jgi:hypothetical protein
MNIVPVKIYIGGLKQFQIVQETFPNTEYGEQVLHV